MYTSTLNFTFFFLEKYDLLQPNKTEITNFCRQRLSPAWISQQKNPQKTKKLKDISRDVRLEQCYDMIMYTLSYSLYPRDTKAVTRRLQPRTENPKSYTVQNVRSALFHHLSRLRQAMIFFFKSPFT